MLPAFRKFPSRRGRHPGFCAITKLPAQQIGRRCFFVIVRGSPVKPVFKGVTAQFIFRANDHTFNTLQLSNDRRIIYQNYFKPYLRNKKGGERKMSHICHPRYYVATCFVMRALTHLSTFHDPYYALSVTRRGINS